MKQKIIAIGGTAAGLSAASKAKRNNPEAVITVYEKQDMSVMDPVGYLICG